MNKNELPKRKNLRLQNYNYNGNGIYFITICTKDKKRIFGKYDVGAIQELPEKHAKNRCVQLNLYGQIVENAITKLPERYNEIEVANYIVMPNHIHILVSINNDIDSERAIRESPLRHHLLSKLIGYLKMNTSKAIHNYNPLINVWQRGYIDHIIRDQSDFEHHWNYIEYNALKEYGTKEENI